MTFFISKPIGIFILVTLILASVLLVMDIVALVRDFKEKRNKNNVDKT